MTLLMGLGEIQLLFWLLATICHGPDIEPARLSCQAGTLEMWTGFIERETGHLVNSSQKGGIGAFRKKKMHFCVREIKMLILGLKLYVFHIICNYNAPNTLIIIF